MDKIEIQATSIVVVGKFNPSIFHPSWLASEGLIRKTEAETAEIAAVHPEVSDFIIGKWCRIYVDRNRFSAQTKQEANFEVLRDLVYGILNTLKHTPVTAIGINYEAHYQLANKEQWHQIGNILAPKDVWKMDDFQKPGLFEIKIQGLRESKTYPGATNITVRPSSDIDNGVFFMINNHYQMDAFKDQPGKGIEEVISLLEKSFSTIITGSKVKLNHLIEKGLAGNE